MKKYTKEEIEAFKERKKMSHANMFYSEQRIDLLVIAISGGGIYVCLETFKYLSEHCSCVSFWLKFSVFFLLFAVVCNFLSQIFGKKTNEHDYLMCLQAEENNQTESKFHDDKSEMYTKAVNISNLTSVISMFIGLILLVVYFSLIF